MGAPATAIPRGTVVTYQGSIQDMHGKTAVVVDHDENALAGDSRGISLQFISQEFGTPGVRVNNVSTRSCVHPWTGERLV